MLIKRLKKNQTKRPVRKPKKPATQVSIVFVNGMLNCPVKSVKDIPYRIKKAPTHGIIMHKAVLYGEPCATGTIFAMTGPRKIAK